MNVSAYINFKYKIVPKKGSPKLRRWKLIRCVFIILRIFYPLPGLMYHRRMREGR